MILHYHRLHIKFQVLKQKLRGHKRALYRLHLQNTNLSQIIKSDLFWQWLKNSEYTFVFPEMPVKTLCLMLLSLNQPTLLVHIRPTCWLLTETALVSITSYIFLSSSRLFSKLGFYITKSSPFQLLSSGEFCCSWLSSYISEKIEMSRDNSINKKYWIFNLETFFILGLKYGGA